jgi:putative endopeptidase
MSRHKTRLLLLAAAILAAQAPPSNGIDRANLDPTCKPCTDFWRYANGGWVDRNPIPARLSGWGTFSALTDANHERLRAILEVAAANQSAPPGSNERKIGDYYAACMDTAAIDARGIQPLQPDLDRIAAMHSAEDLAAALTEFQWIVKRDSRESLTVGPVVLTGRQDSKDSTNVIVNVTEGGLSLPEREYYFKQDARSREIREQFLKHVARMFELLGQKPESAAVAAKTVTAFETSLAEATMTNVQRRDPYATYHKMDLASLAALTPDFDWKPLLRQFHIPESTPINVSQPEFVKKFNRQLSTVPVEDWKTWLRWRVLNLAASNLSKPFALEYFHFASTVLRGIKEQQPRWQTCTAQVDLAMGDALGEAFVRKHFTPEAKRRMNEMVENLRATLREELEHAAWLAPDTRKSAIAKLNAFAPRIGYPDKWRDYSSLKIDRKSYFDNVRATELFDRQYQLAKIGRPVNRDDWRMTPPTVNASAFPARNEITFPAGILQPPFFDVNADDAVNYGAIGAVIGHEMGHHFDDQGSKFDAQGNLKNWWTPEDRKQFEERAACVSDQFDKLDVGEGQHHNGKLVLGEALGDLAGLKLAYKAYKRSLQGQPESPVIDGFTADQRFFLAFARIWAGQTRPEEVRRLLNTNPHPLGRFRVIGTLQNMPEFHAAFQCKPGDPMVRPPAAQCNLW